MSRVVAQPARLVVLEPDWWAWNQAHLGHLAAVALRIAAAKVAATTGAGHVPRSLSLCVPAHPEPGAMEVTATAGRAEDDSRTVTLRGLQGGQPVLLATAVLGAKYSGPRLLGPTAPRVVEPARCPEAVLSTEGVPMAALVEFRPAEAPPGTVPDGAALGRSGGTGGPAGSGGPGASGRHGWLQAWVRFRDGRPLDPPAAAVLADALPPALYRSVDVPRSVDSRELTLHYTDAWPAGGRQLAAGWALARLRTVHAGGGWALEEGQLWSEHGRLLALTRHTRRLAATPVRATG
ncbi:acyl-CoA thioesterase domain-containing protein [Allostreptomyces psammosilenae]|uniref:Acyl-CoA thioesterase n=1 Tax=Allostreptomyces psammosilenae TaxID=1892865 RepID=A0A852ZQ00_9ACTN|nr:acyl-CoA thioesterase domain-containing protein [Allostreptomyces psammosilenae]NYI04449.1 acyl-CoA thioesterase [Allostreptomyces psammosilenae]